MDNAVIIALVEAAVKRRFDNLPAPKRGLKGRPGKDFSLEDNLEEITSIINNVVKSLSNELKLKFNDLSESEKDQLKLKFENLSTLDKEELRGPKGKDGKDGKDGHSFIFEDYSDEINKTINDHIKNLDLKLKFTDLTEDEKEELRGIKGSRGQRGKEGPAGKDGRDGIDGKDGINGKDGKDGKDGEDGVQGDSAYHVWLKLGNEGSEQDYLNSLIGKTGEKGEKGDPGTVGKQGKQGKPGKSAYDIWLEDHEGSEQDYLNSLKGEKGEQGEKGEKGDRGAQGSRGQKGKQGKTGKSSYEVWLENNKGTEEDYFLSLKGAAGGRGPRGPIGPRGFQGFQGRDGRDGEDGKDAPVITDVEVDQTRKDYFKFVFEFSDGRVIETSEIKIPSIMSLAYSMIHSSGGGGGSGDVTVGDGVTNVVTQEIQFIGATVTDNAGVAEVEIDAQLIDVSDGTTTVSTQDIEFLNANVTNNAGTAEVETLITADDGTTAVDSSVMEFVGATVSDNGGNAQITIDQQTISITDGTTTLDSSDICFDGATVSDNGGGQVKVTVDNQDANITGSDEGNVVTNSIKAIDWCGDGVTVTTSTVMADWATLADVTTLAGYEATNPGNLKVTIPGGGATLVTGTINAAQTLAIDTQVLATWNSSDYILTLIAGTKRRKYNIDVANDEGTPVDSLKKVGSNISVDIDSVINGANYELQVTNNEASAIDYKLTKIIH